MKTFYVCSYGGCGSKMLCQALKKYGNVEHIHSRKPPEKLQYIGHQNGGNAYVEWFNGINIPEYKLKDYYVIYIYKNPINSIFSRFSNPKHLEHIQCDDINIKIDDIIDKQCDLYGIHKFYNNYMEHNKKRNYKIYSVKYEQIFEKHYELSNLLGIGNLNLTKKEKNRKKKIDKYYNKLYPVYKDLIHKMNNTNFITIN